MAEAVCSEKSGASWRMGAKSSGNTYEARSVVGVEGRSAINPLSGCSGQLRAGGRIQIPAALLRTRALAALAYQLVAVAKIVDLAGLRRAVPARHRGRVGRDGVDHRVEVEGGQVRILRLHVAARRVVVLGHAHVARPRVVEVGEGKLVLGADGLPDDDLVDVVELVPVVIVLRSARKRVGASVGGARTVPRGASL
jgi:hypothetical protein